MISAVDILNLLKITMVTELIISKRVCPSSLFCLQN